MNGHILLVDDDLEDVEWTLANFKEHGLPYEIRVASDGADALEALLRARDDGEPLPLLMLLDIKMPRMSGLELLERLEADPALRKIPVVLLTSSENEQDIRRAFELGARGYLPKVAEAAGFVRILETVREVLNGGASSRDRP